MLDLLKQIFNLLKDFFSNLGNGLSILWNMITFIPSYLSGITQIFNDNPVIGLNLPPIFKTIFALFLSVLLIRFILGFFHK